MELRHLSYFVRVAELGSVSRAAVQLRITQPALSRQIRDLERELNVTLFDRVGRHIELTASGQDLLRRSHDVLAAAAALSERAQSLQSGDAGVLRVGATPQMLESVLAAFLRQYRAHYPRVEVQLIEDGGLALLNRLQRGELQLAISVPGEGFGSRLLFPARLLAVAHAKHVLARRRRVELAELKNETLLLLRQEFGSRQWFDGACHSAQVRPKVALESASAHTLVALAQSGLGVAIIPSTVLYGRGVAVAPLVVEGHAIGRWLAVNWDIRRSLPAYGRAFVELLASRLSRSHPGNGFTRSAPIARPRSGAHR